MPAEQPPGEPPKSESLPPPTFDADEINVAGGTKEAPQERVVGDVGAPIEVITPKVEPPVAEAKEKKSAKPRAAKKPKATAPAPAPTPAPTPPSPTPPKKPEEYATLAEAGTEGTGRKEEGEAGAVTVPARMGAAGTLAPLGGETLPLHERAEVTVASPDNPEFARFIEEVSERGVFTGLRRKGEAELLKQAFESRAQVARGMIEFFSTNQLVADLGVPFGGKESAPLISAQIEKLSLEQPERVVALNQLLANSRELPRQIAGLEARKQKLASGEELRQATAQMDEKKKVLELAQASNKFWGGLKFWKGEGFGRLTWRKDLREARAKAKEMDYGGALGGISSGVMTRGRVGKKLRSIDADINGLTVMSGAALAETEASLQNAKNRLGALKLEVLGSGAMHEEAAEVTRKGIESAFQKMLNPTEPTVEGYEAAEETLANLEKVVREGDAGTKRMDYLQRINPTEVRAALQKKSEGEAAKALRTLFLKTLENPHAPERLPTLVAALEPWLTREKIGGKKDKLAAALFIREQVKHFHDTEILGKDAELQSRRDAVAAGATRPEDVERLRADETALRTKDALVRTLYAHISSLISERARREPPAPPEAPPSTSPGTPSSTPPEGPSTPPKGTPSETPPTLPETPPSAAETLDPLDQKFASVNTLDELMQTLPFLSAVEFRGRTQTARDVISYLENLQFFFEGGFFATRDPEIKRDYILKTYLPELDSIGSERQPELRAAVRRAVENLPFVKELGITLPPRPPEIEGKETT